MLSKKQILASRKHNVFVFVIVIVFVFVFVFVFLLMDPRKV